MEVEGDLVLFNNSAVNPLCNYVWSMTLSVWLIVDVSATAGLMQDVWQVDWQIRMGIKNGRLVPMVPRLRQNTQVRNNEKWSSWWKFQIVNLCKHSYTKIIFIYSATVFTVYVGICVHTYSSSGDIQSCMNKIVSTSEKCLLFSGPKLFKEPSFKSNKFIIHNALSRCCLAGKVNETQKNKIVEVYG